MPADLGGHRLHLAAEGEGRPTVVLESGVAASSASWRLVFPDVASFTRICCYDRAGLGWSEPSPTPRTAEQCLKELRALLSAAGEQGPIVLVGHSFGGLVGRLYASRYPEEIAGLVLVDSPHPREWLPPLGKTQRAMLERGVVLARRGAWCARLGVVRFCLALLNAGLTRFPQLFARAVSGEGASLARRIVGEVTKLPADVRPVLRALWSQPKCFEAMAQHLAALPESCAQVAATGPFGELPMIVLTASNPTPERLAAQEGVARLSQRGRHLVATHSGHWMQLDQPELVAQAIREVVEAVRAGERAIRKSFVATDL